MNIIFIIVKADFSSKSQQTYSSSADIVEHNNNNNYNSSFLYGQTQSISYDYNNMVNTIGYNMINSNGYNNMMNITGFTTACNAITDLIEKSVVIPTEVFDVSAVLDFLPPESEATKYPVVIIRNAFDSNLHAHDPFLQDLEVIFCLLLTNTIRY